AAACTKSVVHPERTRYGLGIALLDHFQEPRAEVVPAKECPARAAAQVQDPTRLFGAPGGGSTAVNGSPGAVELLGRRFVAATAWTRARINHARGRVAPGIACFNVRVCPTLTGRLASFAAGQRIRSAVATKPSRSSRPTQPGNRRPGSRGLPSCSSKRLTS